MCDHVERLVLNDLQIKDADFDSECVMSNGKVYIIIH